MLIEYKEISKQIGLIIFNRVSLHNALNKEMLLELKNLLTVLNGKINVLILTGVGLKSFIAGADIVEMNNFSEKEFSDFLLLGQETTKLIEESEWVSIAAVNGYALGGGFEIALSCDIILASENAKFGFPEVRLGIIPGFGGTVRLARNLPLNKAKKIIFTGETLTSEQARNLNIINDVMPIDKLLSESVKIADHICKNSLHAVLAAKKTLNCHINKYIEEKMEIEREICNSCFKHSDRNEGMTSFLEKREPKF